MDLKESHWRFLYAKKVLTFFIGWNLNFILILKHLFLAPNRTLPPVSIDNLNIHSIIQKVIVERFVRKQPRSSVMRNYPVYGTQGGGLAREVNGVFIFIEQPDCPGLQVGDEVPCEWDLQPANNLAQEKGNEGLGSYSDVPWNEDPVHGLERMPDRLATWPIN